MNKKKLRIIGMNVVIWVISIILLVPLALVVINSLKTSADAASMSFAMPSTIQWDNFTTVIKEGKLVQSFWNSVIYSVVSTLLATFLSAIAAYVLSRRKTKFNNFLYFFIVLGLAAPVNYVALIEVMQTLNLYGTRLGVVLLYTSLRLSFSVFLIYSFVGKIPRDIDEAAIIDGCGPIQLFFKIIMPLLKPVLITVAVLAFLNAWNEFMIPLYFTGSTKMWPMTLAVYNFYGSYFSDWNLVCADILITCVPVIIVYLVCQKHIVSGMTAGSVKG